MPHTTWGTVMHFVGNVAVDQSESRYGIVRFWRGVEVFGPDVAMKTLFTDEASRVILTPRVPVIRKHPR